MDRERLSRRAVLKAGLAAGATGVLPAAASAQSPQADPFLRFVHLTDIHIQPELGAGEGFAAALQSVRKLDPQPSFIITGGDHVMDAFAVGRGRAEQQWDLYQRVLKQNTDLPVYPLIGNHDVWGWSSRTAANPADPGYGKAMAMQRLGLKTPYYSFDAGGWHFILLDSVSQRGEGYVAVIDGDQQQWLIDDLKRTGSQRPICVVSHIPILSVCVFFDGGGGERLSGDVWTVPDAWMHRDAWSITEILAPYRVPLLLSGHIHLVDRVEYLGKTYICDGAVCGNFWRGPRQQFPEGYGVIDVWPNGRFTHQYISYGWKAHTE